MTPQENATIKAPRWEIDSIFPGGSKSPQYAAFRQEIVKDTVKLEKALAKLPKKLNEESRPKWAKWILDLQTAYEKLHLASAFAGCLTSQDVNDEEALRIDAELDELGSRWSMMKATLESFSVKASNGEWQKLLEKKVIKEVSFHLGEMRVRAKMKMPEELEKMQIELGVNGYHSWNRLYEKMAGDLRVTLEENGQKKEISLGQNAPRMADANREVRRDAFEKMVGAWKTRDNLAAIALNSQAGFRLSIYKRRSWEDPLFEPLLNARMKRATIEAMWSAVVKGRPQLKPYIDAKMKYLGIDKFRWYDQEAPLGKSERKIPFGEAGNFIVEHLQSFSDEMGDFTRMALDKRWIEAEDRPAKGAGGWCSRIAIRKESRIFMTYTGTFSGLSTLAHELGHAYHGWVLKDFPPFASFYPMNLAETASIFNELRVTDAALASSNNFDEKLMLTDQKLANGLTFMSNIHARFIFDSRFYEERKKGVVVRERLNEIMKESQKEAFFGVLDVQDGLHPLFWASKLHFFITGAPFYNFPYTFGYLFANGVYDRAIKEGKAFAQNYRNLLADTGRMSTEEVAMKHLGVDLTREDFWRDAVNRVCADVKPFVKLVGQAD
jgi:pepF/M3 family oligoendopeptidase